MKILGRVPSRTSKVLSSLSLLANSLEAFVNYHASQTETQGSNPYYLYSLSYTVLWMVDIQV